jgi:hypothetical protein
MKRIAAFALLVAFLTVSISLLVPKRQQHIGPRQFVPARPANAKDRSGSKFSQPTQLGRNFGMPPPDTGALSQIQSRSNTTRASPRGTSPGSATASNDSRKRRAWDPNFLASLRDAAEQSAIQFALLDGQMAFGKISRLKHANGEVIHVSGSISQPEAGRFFFQKQTMPGVAGNFVGLVEFPGSQKAFRIEPADASGASELVERSLQSVICFDLPRPVPGATNDLQEISPLKPGDFPTVPVPNYQNGIVVLESLPGSIPVIYLDFQGGYTPNLEASSRRLHTV